MLGYVPGLAGMHDIADYPNAATVPGLVVYRYDAPLCFANAESFRSRALAALDVEPTAHWLLLNMEAVIEIDLTAADAVHQLCDELDARGVIPAMARVKQDLRPDLRAGGLADRIGAEPSFRRSRPRLPRSATSRASNRLPARHEQPRARNGRTGPGHGTIAPVATGCCGPASREQDKPRIGGRQ